MAGADSTAAAHVDDIESAFVDHSFSGLMAFTGGPEVPYRRDSRPTSCRDFVTLNLAGAAANRRKELLTSLRRLAVSVQRALVPRRGIVARR